MPSRPSRQNPPLSSNKIQAPRTRKKKPACLPSYASLTKLSADKVSEWFRAASTSDAYKRSVKEGKAWVAEWAAGMESTVTDGYGEVAGLAAAFDIIGEATPKALHAFVVYKCEIMENSYKTAEAIRSAFKHYFT
jgi:hypothetical protein